MHILTGILFCMLVFKLEKSPIVESSEKIIVAQKSLQISDPSAAAHRVSSPGRSWMKYLISLLLSVWKISHQIYYRFSVVPANRIQKLISISLSTCQNFGHFAPYSTSLIKISLDIFQYASCQQDSLKNFVLPFSNLNQFTDRVFIIGVSIHRQS